MDNSMLSQHSFADLLSISRVVSKTLEPVVSEPKRWYWSDAEVATLRKLASSGSSCKEVALKLGRSKEATASKAKLLGVRFGKSFTKEQIKYILTYYPLYGASNVAKSLGVSVSRVNYFIATDYPNLTVKKARDANPPLPRNLLPYHMVKRVSVLERGCPISVNKIQDSVVVFYDNDGPCSPMMAMHLDDLLSALENHFGRRSGVASGALLSGYRK